MRRKKVIYIVLNFFISLSLLKSVFYINLPINGPYRGSSGSINTINMNPTPIAKSCSASASSCNGAYATININSCGRIITNTGSEGSDSCNYLVDSDGNSSNGCETQGTNLCEGDYLISYNPNPINIGNTVFITCSVSAQGPIASCTNTCPGSGSCSFCSLNTDNDNAVVDTTRLNTSITLLVKAKVQQNFTNTRGNWFKNISLIINSTDSYSDQDYIHVDTYNISEILLPFDSQDYRFLTDVTYNRTQYNTNNFYFETKFPYVNSEVKVTNFLVEIWDVDICKEGVYYLLNNNILIDQRAPRVLITNDPLLTDINSYFFIFNESSNKITFPNKLETEQKKTFFSIDNYNTTFFLKHLNLYSFVSKNPYIIFTDLGSGIKSIVVNKIKGNCNYNIYNKTYTIEDINTSLSSNYESKVFEIIQKDQKGCIFNITVVDNLNNKKKYTLYFPFSSPESQCWVKKSVNGFTNLQYIECTINNELYDEFNKRTEFYISFLPSTFPPNCYLDWYNGKYLYLLNDYKTIFFTESNKVFNLSILNPEKLGINKEEIYKNYIIFYFTENYYNNFENPSSFESNYEELKIRPNTLPVNLDLKAPNIYLTDLFNISLINSSNFIINGKTFYLINENTDFKINLIPASFKVICNDTANCKILKVTICSYSGYCQQYLNDTNDISKEIEIKLKEFPAFIKFYSSDELENNELLEFYFNNPDQPIIEYKFNESYISKNVNKYVFNNNVQLIINASVKEDLTKIKELKINNTKVSNPYTLNLTCEEGKKCEYILDIEAISSYNTVEKETLDILIDKYPGIAFLKILPEDKVYQNYTNAGNVTDNMAIISYCLKRNDMNVTLINNTLYIYNSAGALIKKVTNTYPSNRYDFDGFMNNNDKIKIENKCIFNVLGKIIKINASKILIFDKEGPLIKLFVDNRLVNKNIIKKEGPVFINISFFDNLSGFRIGVIEYNNKKIEVNYPIDNTQISLDVEKGKEIKVPITILAYDNLNNLNKRIINSILDKKPPYVYKQLVSKDDNKVEVKFICNDLSGCNFDSIKCNGINILSNCSLIDNKAICSCSYNSENISVFEIRAKDLLNHSQNYTFYEYKEIGSVEINLINLPVNKGETVNLFCTKDSILPILINLKNYNSKKDKQLKIKYNPLIFINAPKEIKLEKSSTSNLLLLANCVKGTYTLDFEGKEDNIIFNITIVVNPMEFNFDFS